MLPPVSDFMKSLYLFSLILSSCFTNQNLSKSSCVATFLHPLYSSFLLSTNISFTIPIVSRSRSRMEIPGWKSPAAHTGEETGELSFHGLLHEVFFSLHIRPDVHPPQLDQLRQNLINTEHAGDISTICLATSKTMDACCRSAAAP